MYLLKIFLLLVITPQILADSEKNKVISGWVENIKVENIPLNIKAKLDTGAKTSSINATDIERFDNNGEDWVRFQIILPENKNKKNLFLMEKPLVRDVKIKNHDGNYDHRFVVNLNICFNNKIIETQFNLVDRSEFIYPILLGRRFLSGNVIIDPEKTFLTEMACL